MFRFTTCSGCFGTCTKEDKFSFEMVVYAENVKHRILTYQKTVNSLAIGESENILSRFNHLKGKDAIIEYFQDDNHGDIKVMKKIDLI